MNIFICSSMRSGSSHVATCLQKLLGWRISCPQITFQDKSDIPPDEHIINYAVCQVLLPMHNYVFQVHAKATSNNVILLRQFRIKPVVIMRRVVDSLVSLKEQMDVSIATSTPGSFKPPWEEMDETARWDWIAYNAIPWYLSFYSSWKKTDLPVVWSWYDDFFKDQVAGMRKILDHVKPGEYNDTLIAKACDHKEGRFNCGKADRGRYACPSFVHKILDKQISTWGPLADDMRRELL